jgi:hypothetical protein
LSLIKCYSTRTRRRIKLVDYNNYDCLFWLTLFAEHWRARDKYIYHCLLF